MLESQTEVVMRWLRVRSRGALMVFALAIMAYCVNAYAVHWQRCASTPDIFDLTQQVLQGTAQSPYQFQMYVSARVVSGIAVVIRPPIEAVLRRPISDGEAVDIGYWLFYNGGTVLFLIATMRVCALVAGDLAAAIACLFLVGVYPLFWFDNEFRPYSRKTSAIRPRPWALDREGAE